MKTWAVSLLAGGTLLSGIANSNAAAEWEIANGPLKTRWAKDVSLSNVLPEYPRPQMVRKEWQNLNGLWDFAIASKDASQPNEFNGKILVPFPIESALSGVMKMVNENDRIWYKRNFSIPKGWKKQRVLLHFGAVDWDAKVFVNGKEVGSHRGGYDGFSFDITDALNLKGDQELIVSVWDPTDAGTQPRGKQIRNPHGIWYTPTSGIWQTVWLEPVNPIYIESLKAEPSLEDSSVTVYPHVVVPSGKVDVEVEVIDGKTRLDKTSGSVNNGTPGLSKTAVHTVVKVPGAQAWTPETPFLYGLRVTVLENGRKVDQVESYFAMRKISLGKDEKGFTRILLNNKPYFQFGPLDQGFWPDGLYTAPTDEALRYDIEMTKKFGFNMARKHVKVEPDRWYYWCDKLGLLVWQDMPSGDRYIGPNDADIKRTSESAQQFETEWKRIIDQLRNHPSIVMWVPFNEGWGQFDTERIVKLTKDYDPTRLVNNASGWTDRGVGDVNDMHKYPGPGSPPPEEKRAVVLGEFGGLGLPLKGHTWQEEKNWGYRSFADASSLTAAYVKLARDLYPLIETHGLSAAVYTQTTDVEVEVNGLMTYDREVVKPDLERIVPANLGKLPPLPKKVFAAPIAEQGNVTWHYTFEQPSEGWFKSDFDDANWKEGRAGFGTKGTPGGIVKTQWSTGDIWIRRTFTVSDHALKHPRLILHHDEDAEVYVNGVLAAKLSGYTTDYEEAELSPLARAALKPGPNVLSVHCHQTGGGQYIDVGLSFDAPAK